MGWAPSGETYVQSGPQILAVTLVVQRLSSGQWVSIAEGQAVKPRETIRVLMSGAGQAAFGDPPRVWIVQDATGEIVFDTRAGKELFGDQVRVVLSAPVDEGSYTVHGDASTSIFGGRSRGETSLVVARAAPPPPTAPPPKGSPFDIFNPTKWGQLFQNTTTLLVVGGVVVVGAYLLMRKR